jgi:hypothetical protein
LVLICVVPAATQWPPRTLRDSTPWCWARWVREDKDSGSSQAASHRCVRCGDQACIEEFLPKVVTAGTCVDSGLWLSTTERWLLAAVGMALAAFVVMGVLALMLSGEPARWMRTVSRFINDSPSGKASKSERAPCREASLVPSQCLHSAALTSSPPPLLQ